jgi:alanyl-tRNA synthetase
MTGTSSAAEKLLNEMNRLKYKLLEMQYKEIDRISEKLKGKGDVFIFDDTSSPLLVQKMTARVMEECGGICISFSGTDEEGYRYAAGQKNGDLKSLIADMNSDLNGRGGGKPFFLQGSLKARREDIENWLMRVRPAFIKVE